MSIRRLTKAITEPDSAESFLPGKFALVIYHDASEAKLAVINPALLSKKPVAIAQVQSHNTAVDFEAAETELDGLEWTPEELEYLANLQEDDDLLGADEAEHSEVDAGKSVTFVVNSGWHKLYTAGKAKLPGFTRQDKVVVFKVIPPR